MNISNETRDRDRPKYTMPLATRPIWDKFPLKDRDSLAGYLLYSEPNENPADQR